MNRDKKILEQRIQHYKNILKSKESYKSWLRGVAQHVIQEYLSTEKPMPDDDTPYLVSCKEVIDLVVHCIEQQRRGYEQKP